MRIAYIFFYYMECFSHGVLWLFLISTGPSRIVFLASSGIHTRTLGKLPRCILKWSQVLITASILYFENWSMSIWYDGLNSCIKFWFATMSAFHALSCYWCHSFTPFFEVLSVQLSCEASLFQVWSLILQVCFPQTANPLPVVTIDTLLHLAYFPWGPLSI